MHQYTWMMQAAQDLEILSFAFDDDSDIADLVLCGREVQRDAEDIRRPKVGDPLLLVRVLQCNNEMSRRRYTPVGRIEQYMSNVRWPKSAGKRLVIPSWSVSPEYKILLLPYRHGDELPTTRWNHDGTQLTVEWTDQRDLWVFKVDADGRTHVHLRRNE